MKLGIDLGSATAKFAIIDDENKIVYSDYDKHNGHPVKKLLEFLLNIPSQYRDGMFTVMLTGTAGMGLSARTDFPFIQEVIAISAAARYYYPLVGSVIEIGGEDAKFIHFTKNGIPDMKMNGSCAGGTGSFIEQMASLLNTPLDRMNELASCSSKKLSVASRCGVFAKTDAQALINQGHEKADVARAVFDAVAVQYVSTLIGGVTIDKDVLFAGGPLTFFKELRNAFSHHLKTRKQFILPSDSRIFVAAGAALESKNGNHYDYQFIIDKIKSSVGNIQIEKTLPPLFKDHQEYRDFLKRHKYNTFPRAGKFFPARPLFVGVDAGSTTTKMALINAEGKLIDTFYRNNRGDPLEAVREGFEKFKALMPEVKAVLATGYGEELIARAFELSGGVVETFAHQKAGREFIDSIDFILDIGGQDIKAIRIEDGIVADISLNEACSSGTGSFIETFSQTMNISLEDFVKKACFAESPIDLGTRCSVFMNSKVKDALREGYSVDDIAAGLSLSVVKNALYKVIRIYDPDKLGKNVLVQGGTFKNDAVLRAFEIVTGKNVIRVEEAHLMGALGAALYAKEYFETGKIKAFQWSHEVLKNDIIKEKKFFKCKNCGNRCNVSKFIFNNGHIYYAGNKCEKVVTNTEKQDHPSPDFFREKYKILFADIIDEAVSGTHNLPAMGIPLSLQIFEHFPFYYTLLKELGFRVYVSHWTTEQMYKKGISNQLIDNVCLPAKVVNGQVEELIDAGAERIFFPTVIFEKKTSPDALNSYNCPIVTGYPEVLKSIYKDRIRVDNPDVSFFKWSLARRKLWEYFSQFKISRKDFFKAFRTAKNREDLLKKQVVELGKRCVSQAVKENRPVFLIAGRPYHIDPFINHGLMDMANTLGAYTISEEVADALYPKGLEGVVPLTQWSYHNRLYTAAKWAADFDYNKLGVVQLTSFGCGPDAVTVDEVKALARKGAKPYVNIKMDEMVNLGAVKIRLKSLIHAFEDGYHGRSVLRNLPPRYDRSRHSRRIVGPSFAETYNDVFKAVYKRFGYELIMPKTQKRDIIEWGLKYVNNDMCYPAIITIGDIIRQIKDIDPAPGELAATISETGGQCRASNYSALLKTALSEAGYGHVPVAELNASAGSDALKFDKLKMLRYFSVGFTLADAVVRMKLSTRPYEKNKGDTDRAVKFANEKISSLYETKLSRKNIKRVLRSIIERFNAVEVYKRTYPRVGVVGEIYLKTNDFSNNYLIRWLEDHGYEAELPGFCKFMLSQTYNKFYNHSHYLMRSVKKVLTARVLNYAFKKWMHIVEKELRSYHRYREETDIDVGIKRNIIPMSIQFGECWLLPLEVSEMARHGVKYIVSLQPFGCISNHIVSKGMYKRIRENFPELSFLNLDFESGSTNVNIFNRLELFLKGAGE